MQERSLSVYYDLYGFHVNFFHGVTDDWRNGVALFFLNKNVSFILFKYELKVVDSAGKQSTKRD